MAEVNFELYHDLANMRHLDNIAEFREIAERFPWLEFKQPSPEKAPWHVQATISCGEGMDGIVLNFWPHTGKAQRDGCASVRGLEAIRLMIAEAIDDSTEDDAVIE